MEDLELELGLDLGREMRFDEDSEVRVDLEDLRENIVVRVVIFGGECIGEDEGDFRWTL